MVNLKKIKKENDYNTNKDYKAESVLGRSRKNKASIAITSLAIGGGVFVGLLVPGLLPVVMAGAPIMAMSTNIVASGAAATAVGGAHYMINRKEGKLRKASKLFSKGYQREFDDILLKKTSADAASDRPVNKEIQKGDNLRSKYSSKLKKIMDKNEKLAENQRHSNRLLNKEDKIREKLQLLNRSRKAAKDLYNDDLSRLRGSHVGGGSNPIPSTGIVPYRHPNNTPSNEPVIIDANDRIRIIEHEDGQENENNEKKGLGKRISSKLGFFKKFKLHTTPDEELTATPNGTTPGNVAGQTVMEVPNNDAVKKIRTMLNLETPTLEDNAKVFKAIMNLQDETPSCEVAGGEEMPLKNGETIILPAAHAGIDNVVDNINNKSLGFTNFAYENDSTLPMADGFKGVIKIEFENPNKTITYKLNDYQEFISRPLFILTSIIENYGEIKDCGAIKLSSSFVDENDQEIKSAYNFETEITSLQDALKKRNILYTDMLKNIYEKQKDAYFQTPKVVTKLSGLDIVSAICDNACPKCNVTKEKIAEGLVRALSYRNVEFNEEFFQNQFLNSSYDKVMNVQNAPKAEVEAEQA